MHPPSLTTAHAAVTNSKLQDDIAKSVGDYNARGHTMTLIPCSLLDIHPNNGRHAKATAEPITNPTPKESQRRVIAHCTKCGVLNASHARAKDLPCTPYNAASLPRLNAHLDTLSEMRKPSTAAAERDTAKVLEAYRCAISLCKVSKHEGGQRYLSIDHKPNTRTTHVKSKFARKCKLTAKAICKAGIARPRSCGSSKATKATIHATKRQAKQKDNSPKRARRF
jgi:hypothetical protein